MMMMRMRYLFVKGKLVCCFLAVFPEEHLPPEEGNHETTEQISTEKIDS